MWKLTIEDDEGKQTSLPLAHDEYGIGRADANAIRLTDRNVSRKHAVLVRNAQAWVVKDLDSYNGTYVNGLRVAGDQHVAHGDVVQLGDYRLELIDETAAQAADANAQPGQLPVHQRPDRLVVVVGPTPGAEFPLDREHFSVGRAEDANISINHSSVSRFHAEIFALGSGRYEIIDKGSANGIRINGYEIKRGLLEPGDALELGDVRLRFVGRGKIFRAGADQSQQLAAVASFESVAPSVRAPAMQAPPKPGSGIGKFIGIGALLGLIGIAILLLAMRDTGGDKRSPSEEDTPAPETSKLEDKGLDTLKAAKSLFDNGDVEMAHTRLTNIPDDSLARDDPTFAKIAGAWADAIFTEVRELGDTKLEEQQKLLHKIVKANTTVDAARRSKALELMQEVSEKGNLAMPKVAPIRRIARPSRASQPASDIYDDPGESSGATTGGGEPDSPDEGSKSGATDYEGMKQALEPKVFGGTATKKEVAKLRAVCAHLKDAACRDKAAQIYASMPDD